MNLGRKQRPLNAATSTSATEAKTASSAAMKGLTLVELAVVITIIALLATVAVPSYRDYIDRKDIAIARVDIDGIEQAISRFNVSQGRLPDSLAEIGMNGLLDPWGRPYEFLNHSNVRGNGSFRKFKGEVPLNSDYDLYSTGKDGASAGPLTAAASRDDIVRAANGAFIGMAADYDNANFGGFGNSKK